MVVVNFALESAFISVLGILIGSVLGVVVGYQLWESVFQDMGIGSSCLVAGPHGRRHGISSPPCSACIPRQGGEQGLAGIGPEVRVSPSGAASGQEAL